MTDPGEPQFLLSEADLRALAMELQKSGLTFDPARGRKGTITAVSLATSPPTVTLQLSGDTTVSIPGVRVLRTYTPAVNDTAILLDQGNELLALGTVATSSYGIGTTNFVKYSRTTSQNINNNTLTRALFPTAGDTDTSMITVASDRDFTIVKTGVYSVTCNVPWASNTSGSRWAYLGLSSDSSTRYDGSTQNPNNAAAVVHNFTSVERFTAGTVLSVWVYQDSGVTQTLFPSGVMPLSVKFVYNGP
jgi:hypothetical protein